jgi:hypothetical protein
MAKAAVSQVCPLDAIWLVRSITSGSYALVPPALAATSCLQLDGSAAGRDLRAIPRIYTLGLNVYRLIYVTTLQRFSYFTWRGMEQ